MTEKKNCCGCCGCENCTCSNSQNKKTPPDKYDGIADGFRTLVISQVIAHTGCYVALGVVFALGVSLGALGSTLLTLGVSGPLMFGYYKFWRSREKLLGIKMGKNATWRQKRNMMAMQVVGVTAGLCWMYLRHDGHHHDGGNHHGYTEISAEPAPAMCRGTSKKKNLADTFNADTFYIDTAAYSKTKLKPKPQRLAK
jgi:hypothetical protein